MNEIPWPYFLALLPLFYSHDCSQDTLKDWSVVDPSMLTEFRKEDAFSIRSTPKSEAWNYPSATTFDASAIPAERVDQRKREFAAALDRKETSKNVPA